MVHQGSRFIKPSSAVAIRAGEASPRIAWRAWRRDGSEPLARTPRISGHEKSVMAASISGRQKDRSGTPSGKRSAGQAATCPALEKA